jgi:release factor glutamine methyltransferase
MAAAGRVMTPRPASERLIDAAVAITGDRPARIADVGTGSGVIAVALAAALPRAEVFGTDTSAAAVLLARANVARLQLGDRVTILHGNLLDPIPGALDLIVANLPYLPLAEANRHPELAGEPPEAVFAPGDGLDGYRALVAAGWERLTADGVLVIQLRRRVLAARRDQLDTLAATLADLPTENANARSDAGLTGAVTRRLISATWRPPRPLGQTP